VAEPNRTEPKPSAEYSADVRPKPNFGASLLLSKCIPVLLYGLEACPLNKSQLASLDFVINRFFMKLFNTNSMETVRACRVFLV